MRFAISLSGTTGLVEVFYIYALVLGFNFVGYMINVKVLIFQCEITISVKFMYYISMFPTVGNSPLTYFHIYSVLLLV